MRHLVLKFILPTTIILFGVFTKWWYAIPVDGPDKFYWGFPFAFVGEGFHTSMSLQFFLLEMIADFILYFLFCMLIAFLVKRYLIKPRLRRIFSGTAWSLSLLLIIGFVVIVSSSNPVFLLKRPYDWRLLNTGFIFIWQQTPQQDINSFPRP